MKITVITDSKREILGAIRGSAMQFNDGGGQNDQAPIFVGLVPGPDQTFTEIEVPEQLANRDAAELLEGLKDHLQMTQG